MGLAALPPILLITSCQACSLIADKSPKIFTGHTDTSLWPPKPSFFCLHHEASFSTKPPLHCLSDMPPEVLMLVNLSLNCLPSLSPKPQILPRSAVPPPSPSLFAEPILSSRYVFHVHPLLLLLEIIRAWRAYMFSHFPVAQHLAQWSVHVQCSISREYRLSRANDLRDPGS